MISEKKKKILGFIVTGIIVVVMFFIVGNKKEASSLTDKQLEFIDRVIEVAESYENFEITKEEAIKIINDLKFQFDRLPTKASKNKTEQKLHLTDTSRISNTIDVLSFFISIDHDLSDSISYLKNISMVY